MGKANFSFDFFTAVSINLVTRVVEIFFSLERREAILPNWEMPRSAELNVRLLNYLTQYELVIGASKRHIAARSDQVA